MRVLHVRLVNQPLVKYVALFQKKVDTPAAGPWRRRNCVHPKRREWITDSWRHVPSTTGGVSVPVATYWDIFHTWDILRDECRATWRGCREVMFVVKPWRYVRSKLCILSYRDFPRSLSASNTQWSSYCSKTALNCCIEFFLYYVEIKCQLDATDDFLLQILLFAQHVSGTIMPIIRSPRVLYRRLLPVAFGALVFTPYRQLENQSTKCHRQQPSV